MHLKILIFIFLLTLKSAFAFKLSPMKAELDFQGKKATKSFRIINDTKENIKVEAEVLTREIDINNKETRNETTDFTLYPPQLEVEAGKSKVIRVSYVGGSESSEKAYRLVVRQFPSDNQKKEIGAQINILFEYVASLYVGPAATKSNLVVEKCVKLNNLIELNFQNQGTKHSLLKNYKLELVQDKKRKIIDFTENKFQEFATQNILAGLKRKIMLKDTEFTPGKISAKFIKK